ncbi:hypothetical protein [Hyalangium sp.]|uniref:hypothetical protein n=1 Tax=Hyalangium sp. TaxID=2028555 RepID=UPI002D6D6B68|nr:hypothetical protein [Hyalangium sp.]HYH94715.1 hypothetical protein [Hyalangium sp.]
MSARRSVVALSSVLVALGVWMACTGGLKVEEGNAFPCKFDVAEADRDKQCPEEWRCGIDGRCHEAQAEQGTLGDPPSFSPERRYPKVLMGETGLVAGEAAGPQGLEFGPSIPPESGPLAVVKYTDGGVVLATPVSAAPVSAPLTVQVIRGTRSMAFVGNHLAVMGEETQGGRVGLFDVDRPTTSLSTSPKPVTEGAAGALLGARKLRATSLGPPGASRDMLVVIRGREDPARANAGEVNLSTGSYTAFPSAFSTADGGVTPCSGASCGSLPGYYLDVRPAPLTFLARREETDGGVPEPVPVAVTPLYFLWRSQGPEVAPPAGVWQVLNPTDPIAALAPDGTVEAAERWQLRYTDTLGVWALRRVMAQQDVLSTWVLSRPPGRPQEPRLERAWDDCSPCGRDPLVAFTPVTDGALGVEVLCESQSGVRSLFRVVGASVVTARDTCLRQPLESPLELAEVPTVELQSPGQPGKRRILAPGAVDESQGAWLTMGGSHGQLWRGTSLSRLRPMFLDRTPTALGILPKTDAGPPAFIAASPNFFAIQLPPPQQEDSTGLTVVTPMRRDGMTEETVALETLVEGVSGWFMLETGQLAQVARDSAGRPELSNAYGPQLLAPSGAPAQAPFLGQGVPHDGGVSLVLTANDQLYYTELSSSDLVLEPELGTVLQSKLTPEPDFPVRSLARDRTVNLSAEEGVVVRGWVATGRSVFEYSQDARTKAWAMKKLELGSGEPVEVWSREAVGSGYGRVGLRDGQVLRLPEGIPLTRPLPAEFEDRVADYSVLEGWPVALGEKAVYRTVRSTGGQSGLLAWEPLALPAELASTGGLTGARMFVVNENGTPALYLVTSTGFVYPLGKGVTSP